ncbi:glutaredoxin family protein [Rhodococcus sp. NPDC059968]|uniref:glutaredoxin family protein n=1 Tax=Rhodococcus sp. NPDC059968 TaxID=3347017 RepID=UPI00366AEDE7
MCPSQWDWDRCIYPPAASPRNELPGHRVRFTIYGTPACAQCTAAYRALDKEGLDYTIVEITQDPVAHDYVRGLGYLHGPCLRSR